MLIKKKPRKGNGKVGVKEKIGDCQSPYETQNIVKA